MESYPDNSRSNIRGIPHPDDAALTVLWEFSQDAWMAYGEADLYRESEPDEAEASAEGTLYDCKVDDGD